MPRIDKVVPGAGNFRAPLAAAYGFTAGLPDKNHADIGKVVAVSLDANGRVVRGTAGAAGFKGVICLGEPKGAGEIVDVMQTAEIVEFTTAAGAAAASGTNYTSNADGTYGTTAAGAANFRIGFTVEATRLIVRCNIQP